MVMNIKIVISISIILITLLSIYFKKQKPEIRLESKIVQNEKRPEKKSSVSRFMIDESISPVQHIAAGLFSLPDIYQRYKTYTIDSFVLPNGEKVYAESFYHENLSGDVHVLMYKRVVDYPNSGDSQFHIMFKTINQKDEWYEINLHGALTGFGIGKTATFWTNPPYGSDRFKEVSVHTYKEKQFWTDQLLESMIALYYHMVVPLSANNVSVKHFCYRATGKLFYDYERYPDGVLYITLYDEYSVKKT